MGNEMFVVSVRMNHGLITRLKRLQRRLKKSDSDIGPQTISSVIRLAIVSGLEVLEGNMKNKG